MKTLLGVNLGLRVLSFDLFNDLTRDPIIVYKNKGDTMHSLKQKISSVYKKHRINPPSENISRDCHQCISHGKVHLFM